MAAAVLVGCSNVPKVSNSEYYLADASIAKADGDLSELVSEWLDGTYDSLHDAYILRPAGERGNWRTWLTLKDGFERFCVRENGTVTEREAQRGQYYFTCTDSKDQFVGELDMVSYASHEIKVVPTSRDQHAEKRRKQEERERRQEEARQIASMNGPSGVAIINGMEVPFKRLGTISERHVAEIRSVARGGDTRIPIDEIARLEWGESNLTLRSVELRDGTALEGERLAYWFNTSMRDRYIPRIVIQDEDSGLYYTRIVSADYGLEAIMLDHEGSQEPTEKYYDVYTPLNDQNVAAYRDILRDEMQAPFTQAQRLGLFDMLPNGTLPRQLNDTIRRDLDDMASTDYCYPSARRGFYDLNGGLRCHAANRELRLLDEGFTISPTQMPIATRLLSEHLLDEFR